MSHTEFKALLKKINLKPKGVQEIVLEISDGALAGKIDVLSALIDGRVAIAVDSEIVRYNVQINARTEQPMKSYKVDERGVVSEVKPQGVQVEMDLDIPMAKDQIKDVPEEISREVVDEFILSGLAPRPEGLWYPIQEWIERLAEGETYLRLANEAKISSGKIVDIIDEYRQSVAPLAAKWDEWRQNGKPVSEDDEDVDSEDRDDQDEEDDTDSDTLPSDSDSPEEQQPDEMDMEDDGASTSGSIDTVDDWEQELKGESADSAGGQPDEAEDLDTYILRERPVFEDIPYDFPALLQRRKGGETWMIIAGSLGISSGKLSTAWRQYKQRVADSIGGVA
ncbi:hypothetical protein ACFOQM_05955 [Paenibacillus sp. GCM10012307]|uniref:2-methylcitrate dehydratase n=1 Tax=Paenibacillus roseus TaxID=2798579 RepID=A0A934IX03_9BACL|nr:hypothetical protein [Paenibacillus roseus]MBJ6360841.1 hypothetical protein [Paenibacillus roseus]